MKEKRECKIIQDLLPNYIEDLTNEETNHFIEEHLKECDECQKMLENMKRDLKVNSTIGDAREVKYIKKYNSKLKLLRNVLVLIIIITFIVVGRKICILTSLSNKAEAIKDRQNYHEKLESYNDGKMNILEFYYKDGKSITTISIYSEGSDVIKRTIYKSEEETIDLIDNGQTKIMKNNEDIIIEAMSFTPNSLLENLFIAITTSIDKVNLNGQKCYIIRENNTEKFIDANTGLTVKMIDNQNNRTVDYKYEFGSVKDKDVTRPDTTGYTLME